MTEGKRDYAQVSLRVPKDLKDRAFAQIKALDATPTEVFKDVLAYIAREGKLPVSKRVVSHEDAELLKIIREQMAQPGQAILVNLSDLREKLKIDIPSS